MLCGKLNLAKIREENGLDSFQYLISHHSDIPDILGSSRLQFKCLEWQFPLKMLEKVCEDIKRQVGDEFTVLMPLSERRCIIIVPAKASETMAWLKSRIREGMKPISLPDTEPCDKEA